MKRIINNIFTILDTNEKKHIIHLILMDIFISVLDITFLAILLYIIQFYTQASHSAFINHFPLNLFDTHPLFLIIIFSILFSFKNWFGLYIFRRQIKFVYNVASRLSEKNLINYFKLPWPSQLSSEQVRFRLTCQINQKKPDLS